MTEIVNLNKARKKKRAETAEKQAAVNRAKFGRTKAAKSKEADEEARRRKQLDDHERER